MQMELQTVQSDVSSLFVRKLRINTLMQIYCLELHQNVVGLYQVK